MSRHVQGQPVESIEAIEQPGDYFVSSTDAGIEALWFAMPGFPSHKWNRINGPAWPNEPRWEISRDVEGVVTVSPSIRSQWNEGEVQRCFHAFLKGGVWEILDDSIGAVFD